MSANHKSPCVITIGNFDGVHKGHTALINTAVSFAHDAKYRKQFLDSHARLAECYTAISLDSQASSQVTSTTKYQMPDKTNLQDNLQVSPPINSPAISQVMEARIITFSPHPAQVLGSQNFIPLMSDSTRLFSLEPLGADYVSVLPFHQAFAKQSAEDFCVTMVRDYNMKMLFIGHDFKMGCDRAGIRIFEEIGSRYGFCVHALAPITIENNQMSCTVSAHVTQSRASSFVTSGTHDTGAHVTPATPLIISSTHIRKALQSGEIKLATQMLGKHFSIGGIVEHGAKRGGDLLGFPTANLKAEPTVIPRNGIYASLCKILIPKYDGYVFLGVTNIGHNPTFGDFGRSIETYILDFKDNLYDLPMEIAFVQFIRDEVKFNSVEELIKQITADTNAARKILEAL